MYCAGGKGVKLPPVEDRVQAYGRELRYVLDLIIAAYFQFDSNVDGYISKQCLAKQLDGAEGVQGKHYTGVNFHCKTLLQSLMCVL
jgi:hypothetical protein